MMTKRAISLLIALVLAFALLPLGAAAAEREAPAPAEKGLPYNEHDVGRLRALFEQKDAEGVKNGAKLFEGYSTGDPSTWGENDVLYWIEAGGEKRIDSVYVGGYGVCGVLNLSGCEYLRCVSAGYNKLTAVNVSGCAQLEALWCQQNLLESLDISGCAKLATLSCDENRLKKLDLSSCPLLPFETVTAVGKGYVGYDFRTDENKGSVYARTADTAETFLGWYDETGEEVSGYFIFAIITPVSADHLTARFTGETLKGDVDGSGDITVLDAVLALRIAMAINEADADTVERADFDGSGDVTVLDAVMILRKAMEII